MTNDKIRSLGEVLGQIGAPCLIIEVDNYRIAYANPAVRLPPGDGDTLCHELLHGLDRPCDLHGIACPIGEVRKSNAAVVLEHSHLHGKGERIYELHAHPIVDETGRLTHILESKIDVTEQRRARASSKPVGTAPGRFATGESAQQAAGMAHDVGNVLQCISAEAERLDESGEGRGAQEAILHQVERGSRLIRQMLDCGRRSTSESRTIDLKAWLEQEASGLQNVLPRSIEVVVATIGNEFSVLGDTSQLQRALLNLALNARDAMPDGGRLTLSLEELRVEPGQMAPFDGMWPGKWLRLSVEDSGSGIAESALPQIFRPFFTTKRSGEGTGLGLAQVYGIVKQHGGFIDCTSQAGAGSRFDLFIPQVDRHLVSLGSSASQLVPVDGVRSILVVEDEEALLWLLQKALTRCGFQVMAATSAADGLALLDHAESGVDLLLVDLHLPDQDGPSLLSQVRKTFPGLPAILMSGDEPEPEIARAFQSVLLKPFSLESLLHLLQADSRTEASS